MKRYGNPQVLVTDKLRSYGAAMKVIGNADRQETGRWLNNRAENSHSLPGSGLPANHEKDARPLCHLLPAVHCEAMSREVDPIRTKVFP